MARRKSLRQIEAQAGRLQREIYLMREGRDVNAGNARRDQLARRAARVTNAADRYSNNITRLAENRPAFSEYARRRTGRYSTDSQIAREVGVDRAENRQYPRSVYMGSTYPAGRGITISQESLDAFRRRRDAAANGLNAG